jgi:hypothetical protein
MWGHPVLPRLQTKKSRLGGGGGWEAAAGGGGSGGGGGALPATAAATATPATTSTLLPLTPTQAAVLLGREGLALAQVRAVTGALASPAAVDEGGGGGKAGARLTGTPAQVAGAVAMVQALLMAAGV